MQTPHILIVEDELVTRNTLKSIFEAEGYDVFEATDGAEMHQILSEYDINLVIMDINLPGKNGLLLARELREQANVALMFLTGRDNEVEFNQTAPPEEGAEEKTINSSRGRQHTDVYPALAGNTDTAMFH